MHTYTTAYSHIEHGILQPPSEVQEMCVYEKECKGHCTHTVNGNTERLLYELERYSVPRGNNNLISILQCLPVWNILYCRAVHFHMSKTLRNQSQRLFLAQYEHLSPYNNQQCRNCHKRTNTVHSITTSCSNTKTTEISLNLYPWSLHIKQAHVRTVFVLVASDLYFYIPY